MRDARDIESRYPEYDVLAKRNGPSWNEQTRRVITERLAVPSEPRFFTRPEYETVTAIADRIVPQTSGRAIIPVAALVDDKLYRGRSDGYRAASMPRENDLWRLGLRALDAESLTTFGNEFRSISDAQRDSLLGQMQAGHLKSTAWGSVSPSDFFKKRMARDIVLAYYAHPAAWSEIGWGGPASPRGYVRLDFDERDPWEAAEASGANDMQARRLNRNVG